DSCMKPDVYFIIFDEFEGSKGINAFWQYDNSNLDSFLINCGYYLAKNSKSNYNFTPFSIGSILNMDYHKMKFEKEVDLLQFCKGIKTIENNRVCRIFQNLGYTIINHSFFKLPGDNENLNPAFLGEKSDVLLTPTLYNQLDTDIG